MPASPPAPLPRVGPFELLDVLGRGGMGVVYRARHLAQDTVAAVKFDLHPPDPEWDEVFLNEVRLMAGLDHPSCVVVYDTARVEDDEVAGLVAEIRPGASWLAMELADGGSLDQSMPTRWDEALHVMRALLAALAHAHARGVVHRDIKPANLLLSSIEGSGRTDLLGQRVVLSDFGIGHAADKPTWMDQESVGTPRYMAPEQIEATWRDQGAWTDLYQCGVLLWRLVTGGYPLKGRTAVALYRAHLFTEPGAFEPAFPVPDGLEALCRRLLAKPWRERPDSAAKVLEALEALGDPVERVPDIRAIPEDDPLETTATQITASPGRADTTTRSTVLRGAGLGLWGLRKLPLIGRTRECHALSHALRLVEIHGSPRFAAIIGPAGVGKTRLAEWLTQSAVEQGRARSWKATHGEQSDPDRDGMRGMLRRELRLGGLEGHDVRSRLEGWFPDQSDLVAVLERWCGDEPGSMPSMFERAQALVQVLDRIASDRSLVVWLEDAHRNDKAEESLRFVRYALGNAASPVLFVSGFRDEGLAAREGVRALAEELQALEHSRTVRLGPLPDVQHQELVRRLLGLDPELAIEVERKTAGNPQFAVQLVNDWVERGVLVPGPAGLDVREGASRDVPDDVLGVWRSRLAELLPTLTSAQVTALELAAQFGATVDAELWEAACGKVGADPGDLLVQLVRRGLAASVGGRDGTGAGSGREWAFGHELFRQVVRRHAGAGGRLEAWAGVVADTLLDAGIQDLQVADLLLLAGRPGEAFEPLRMSVNHLLDSGDMRSEGLIDRLEAILTDIDAPTVRSRERADPRWANVFSLRAWYCRVSGETTRGERLAAKAIKWAERSGDASALGWAYREAGMMAMHMGDTDDAVEDFEHASRLLESEGRSESASLCLIRIADIWLNQGASDDAEVLYRKTLGAFERPAAWNFAYEPHMGLARVAATRGDLDAAFAHLADARQCVQRAGQRRDRMRLDNFEGDLRRKAGQMAEAARRYRDVVTQAIALNLGRQERFARLNLAILSVTMQDFDAAAESLDILDRSLSETAGDPVLEGFSNLVRLPVLAAAGDDAALAGGIQRGEAFTESTGLCEPDVALMCRTAAMLTSREDLARGLTSLAERHTPD